MERDVKRDADFLAQLFIAAFDRMIEKDSEEVEQLEQRVCVLDKCVYIKKLLIATYEHYNNAKSGDHKELMQQYRSIIDVLQPICDKLDCEAESMQ